MILSSEGPEVLASQKSDRALVSVLYVYGMHTSNSQLTFEKLFNLALMVFFFSHSRLRF